jgi:hypothetical protein
MSGITSPEKCNLQIIKLQNYVTQMLRIPSLSLRACCPESSSRTRPSYALFCLHYPLCKLVYLPSMSITSQMITQNLMMQLLIDGGKDFAVPKSANLSSSCGHCNQEFDHMTSQGLHHINTFTQVSVTSE